jgi:hypothetical protein
MMDKPKNRELAQRHHEHKTEKLRQQIRLKHELEEKLAREVEKSEEENRDSFVFRLADESFPVSECDADEDGATKELPPKYEKFDYPINESELEEFKRQLNEKSLDVIKGDKLLATSRNNANDDDGKEIGISCGRKIGSRVMLRNFQDRICDEPRGETNYYHLKDAGNDTSCLTHRQWLDAMANDPEISVSGNVVS